MQAALADLREGRADGLLICKLDRLTRSVRDLGALLEGYFGRYALLSVADSIDTRSAGGRLVLHVLGSVSQWEREAICERTRDALHHLQQASVRIGGVPLGWRRAEATDAAGRRLWVEDRAERATVERIAELRAAGASLRRICDVF